MELKYEKICRLCLRENERLTDIFEIKLGNYDCGVIDFLRRITELRFCKLELLPNNICAECVDYIIKVYEFTKNCEKSESLLRNEETKRILRKIELEALSEETEASEECSNDDEDDQKVEYASDGEKVVEEIVIAINSTQKTGGDKHKCNICGGTFGNKIKLIQHEKTHDQDKPYKCEECLQTFSMKNHLNVHLRSHTKEEDKKFTCETCNKQFLYKFLLTQHEYKHTNDKPYPCTKCDKGCLTAESLRRHMKTHDENYKKKSYECTVCKKVFLYPSYLAEHLRCHTGERPHLCSTCGKGFRQIGALHMHQKTHTGYKPFACNICNYRFLRQGNLRTHMRKHTNERPYVCDICGMSFKQSADLKAHQRTHSGEKPVLCTICGKSFTNTGQLTVHIRSHTGERPFPCNSCQKCFTTRSLLRKHERVHTGERPYLCKVCGKSFAQNSSLKSHLITHTKSKKIKKSEKSGGTQPIRSDIVTQNIPVEYGAGILDLALTR